MNKRRLRNAGVRPKAFLGMSEESAILTAAGINVAGSLAAAAIGGNAAKAAAQAQAKATIQAAQRQSQAIKDQTAKSREYQEQAQEFTKEQNAENRELQRDVQMQLQLLTGQQNIDDRLEASKLTVKAGGKTRKLRMPTGLLRGGNMPFRVTDGGGVVPIGITPEGYDLYEILGNDHEHYHKTRGGKYKSGVGIKFADGNIVEGEGNQKKYRGELMLVTPDDAYFISKHSINGFNPAEAVEQGLHPLEAYAIQEREKDIIGLNDDGTKAKYGKRKLRFAGGSNAIDMYNMTYPQLDTDTIGDTAVGVAYTTQNPIENRRLRYGGKARRRAYWGTDNQGRRIWIEGAGSTSTTSNGPGNGGRNSYYGQTTGGSSSSTTTPISSNGGPGTGGRTGINTYGGGNIKPGATSTNNGGQQGGVGTHSGGGFSGWVNRNVDLISSGLTALGNIGGAWITSSANRSAAKTLANAENKGDEIMDEAYRNLQTIDMNRLRREDYRAAHMMPALQAPVSFAANQIAEVNRSLQRRLRNAGRYSMSSAAAQDRMSIGEVESQDARNKIYSADQQQMQDIRQKNAERISEASRINAMLDTEANTRFGQDYLKLLQYNNDIENQRILGSAGALSEGAVNAANAIAQGQTSSAQDWANALANSGLTFSNTLSSMAKRRADIENVMLGSTMGGRVNYLSKYGSKKERDKQKTAIQRAINSGSLSPDDKAMYQYYLELLS